MDISFALVFVVAVRLLLPLLIFKMPIVGLVLAAAADALDVLLLDALGAWLDQNPYQGLDYQFFDKWLDMYYLAFALFVSLSWKNLLARNTSIALFAFRLAGLVLFEITGIRKLFFFFPNLFENFYLYYAVAIRFFPKFVPRTLARIILALLILAIPKLVQEWILHYQEINTWVLIKNFLGFPF